MLEEEEMYWSKRYHGKWLHGENNIISSSIELLMEGE